MPNSNTILLVDFIVALLTIRHFVGDGRQRKPLHRAGTNVASNESVDAFVRVARFNDHLIAEQVQVLLRIAPSAIPTAAIVACGADVPQTMIDISQVRAARGWVGGRPSFAVGDPLAMGRTLRPLDRAIASWELELITSTGDVLRCYGNDSKVVEGDLLRLRRLIGFHPAGWQELHALDPRSTRLASVGHRRLGRSKAA